MTNIAETLLDSAYLQRGERVLDVGCGCGATTLLAAGAVGSEGAVIGVDVSALMLGVARQRVADENGVHLDDAIILTTAATAARNG